MFCNPMAPSGILVFHVHPGSDKLLFLMSKVTEHFRRTITLGVVNQLDGVLLLALNGSADSLCLSLVPHQTHCEQGRCNIGIDTAIQQQKNSKAVLSSTFECHLELPRCRSLHQSLPPTLNVRVVKPLEDSRCSERMASMIFRGH